MYNKENEYFKKDGKRLRMNITLVIKTTLNLSRQSIFERARKSVSVQSPSDYLNEEREEPKEKRTSDGPSSRLYQMLQDLTPHPLM